MSALSMIGRVPLWRMLGPKVSGAMMPSLVKFLVCSSFCTTQTRVSSRPHALMADSSNWAATIAVSEYRFIAFTSSALRYL